LKPDQGISRFLFFQIGKDHDGMKVVLYPGGQIASPCHCEGVKRLKQAWIRNDSGLPHALQAFAMTEHTGWKAGITSREVMQSVQDQKYTQRGIEPIHVTYGYFTHP
jgi:hypothetical protein